MLLFLLFLIPSGSVSATIADQPRVRLLLTHFGQPTPWTAEEVQIFCAKARNELDEGCHSYNKAKRVWAQKPYDSELQTKHSEPVVENVAERIVVISRSLLRLQKEQEMPRAQSQRRKTQLRKSRLTTRASQRRPKLHDQHCFGFFTSDVSYLKIDDWK